MKRTPVKSVLFTLSLLTVSAALAAGAPALGGNITTEYSAAELINRAGILDIGKGDLWAIDFPEPVQQVVSSNAGLVKIEVTDNVVYMTGMVTTGQAPIMIQLESGTVQNFMVRAKAGSSAMRKVVVRAQVTSGQGVAPNIAPAAPAASVPASAPVSAARPQANPLNTLKAAPALGQLDQARANLTSSLQQLVDAKRNTAEVRPAPGWVGLTASRVGDGLQVVVMNRGTRPLILDARFVTVKAGDASLATDVTGALGVGAGESQTSTLALAGAPQGAPLQLEWLAYDRATNLYYSLTANVR